MLCALADGLQAFERCGVTDERLLLIGGGAQNLAVQRIATQVFGRDIDVPDPGEYVAIGAARQAAWVLTHERPVWSTATTTLPADPCPGVLEAYRRVAGR